MLRVMVPDLGSVHAGAFGLVALALGLTFVLRLPMLLMIAATVITAVLLQVIGLN